MDSRAEYFIYSLAFIRKRKKTISLLEHFDLECVYRGTHRDIREKQEHLSESVKINIMRDIIREKIARQLDFIVQNDQIKNKNRLIQNLAKNLSELEHARSLDHIRLIEANAASLYFSALSKLPLNWLARDKKRIPSEWATIGERSSELSALNNAQHATRPFHALLNYLYATLANRIYLYTMIYGLNPTLGIMHTYNPYRASLVYDIIEPFRPLIDTQLVNLLQSTPLSREVIKQDNSGQCWFIPEYLQYILASVLPDEHTIEQYVKQIVKRIKDA
jgi:CRISPR-associated protein Cas1